MNIQSSFKHAEPITPLCDELQDLHGRLVHLKCYSALLADLMVRNVGVDEPLGSVAAGVELLAKHIGDETVAVTDLLEDLPYRGEIQ